MQPQTGLRENSITDMPARTMPMKPMKQLSRWSDSPSCLHANAAVVIWRLTEERLEQEAEKLLGKPEAPGATHRSLQSLSMSASSESRESVARAFADAINRHSVDGLAALMTEDHVFIDSLGNRVEGREAVRKGWIGYVGMVPDYTIAIHETYSADRTIIMVGTAQGTLAVDGQLLPENRWQTPAAWRAEIRGGQLASVR